MNSAPKVDWGQCPRLLGWQGLLGWQALQGFSPKLGLAVRFHKTRQANAARWQCDDSGERALTWGFELGCSLEFRIGSERGRALLHVLFKALRSVRLSVIGHFKPKHNGFVRLPPAHLLHSLAYRLQYALILCFV